MHGLKMATLQSGLKVQVPFDIAVKPDKCHNGDEWLLMTRRVPMAGGMPGGRAGASARHGGIQRGEFSNEHEMQALRIDKLRRGLHPQPDAEA